MAVLTVVDSLATGLTYTPTVSATTAGDSFANDGRSFFLVLNSSGANAYTIGIVTPATAYGQPVQDVTVTVGTSAAIVAGPFPTAAFNDTGGAVNLTYSGSAPNTDLKVKVFSLP